MPFQSRKPRLNVSEEVKTKLEVISRSRTEASRTAERARILLAYAEGSSVSTIAEQLHLTRPKVNRCVNKALQLGALASLADLGGRGKPAVIGPEARTWVVALACQKPKELGYSFELWTTRLLAAHIRKTCQAAGHAALAQISRGTVSKILAQSQVRPHKISYYVERRDPAFEAKMTQVLYVYKEVEMLHQAAPGISSMVAVLSYDEKPGIQAIENTAPDLPPIPGQQSQWGRDHEYIRHGTVSLMAGIDLLTGRVHGQVVDRHRSREFIAFLKRVDQQYPPQAKIRLVLDNHSAHISRETRAYLAQVPNRFEFIFTPTHGSWLNLIESFFGKMAKTMLRGIRVSSKQELKNRIETYLAEINETPVIFRWKYRMEEISVTG
jgi:transposase